MYQALAKSLIIGMMWGGAPLLVLHCIYGGSDNIIAEPSSSPYSSSRIGKSKIDYNFCLKNEQKCDQYKRMIISRAEELEFSLKERSYLLGLAKQESWFDPNARNSSGASGLMGVKPIAARAVGSDPDLLRYPEGNIDIGLRYLKKLQTEKFGGDFIKALVAYNLGPTRFKVMVERGEITDPAQFKYIQDIEQWL